MPLDSGDCSSTALVPKQYFNLKHPFNVDNGVEPDLALRWAFGQFVDAGTYKKPKVGAIYKKEKDWIRPYVFGDHHIVKKEWFHTLNYSGRPLDDTHIDVIFYYLRKKIKYDVNISKSFTTINFLFRVMVKLLYDQFLASNRDYVVIPKDHEIAEYMRGSYMPCNISWHTVDHVPIPIGLKDEWHWILGVLTFKDRCIHVYDSMRGARHDAKIREAVEPYAVLIARFLASTGFYRKRHDIDLTNELYRGKPLADPLAIHMVDDLPQQEDAYVKFQSILFLRIIIYY